MKKISVLLLAILMAFAFVSCDDKTEIPAPEKEYFEVGSFDALKKAIEEGKKPIKLTADIEFSEPILLEPGKDVEINGDGHVMSFSYDGTSKVLFNYFVKSGLEGLQSETSLAIYNSTIENTNKGAQSQGYITIIGFDSSAVVTIEGCTFTNLYTGVYCQEQNTESADYSLVIRNCEGTNTKYACSTYQPAGKKVIDKQVVLEGLKGFEAENEFPAVDEDVLPDITSFTKEDIYKLTDNGYRGTGSADSIVGVADGKYDLSKGDLAFYMGSTKTIKFANGETEKYPAIFKPGEQYKLSITFEDAKNLVIGANACSQDSVITLGTDALREDELAKGKAEVTLKITDTGIEATINNDQEAKKIEVSGTYRTGFVVEGTATLTSLKVERI